MLWISGPSGGAPSDIRNLCLTLRLCREVLDGDTNRRGPKMGGGGGNRRAGGGARELNDGWEPWKTQGMNLTLGPTGVTLIGEEGARGRGWRLGRTWTAKAGPRGGGARTEMGGVLAKPVCGGGADFWPRPAAGGCCLGPPRYPLPLLRLACGSARPRPPPWPLGIFVSVSAVYLSVSFFRLPSLDHSSGLRCPKRESAFPRPALPRERRRSRGPPLR